MTLGKILSLSESQFRCLSNGTVNAPVSHCLSLSEVSQGTLQAQLRLVLGAQLVPFGSHPRRPEALKEGQAEGWSTRPALLVIGWPRGRLLTLCALHWPGWALSRADLGAVPEHLAEPATLSLSTCVGPLRSGEGGREVCVCVGGVD